MTSRFIVLEGGDSSGKSTQARMLADRLRGSGRDIVLTREPGGTALGSRLREMLLHGDASVDARAELLLMAADRAQHVAELVRPALARGADVVSDRFTPSTLAYQGRARDLGVDDAARISAWAAVELEPDLVVVLDVDEDVTRARNLHPPDRVEREGEAFQSAVRAAYRELAPAHGWIVVDGAGTPEEVADRVWKIVQEHLDG